MADVRCPMCGKDNPADLEACQYCQARLRPIWEAALAGGQTEDTEDQGADLPDWLKSLRTPEEEQPGQSAAESEDQSSLPDWLSGLRQQPADSGGLEPDATSEGFTARSEDSTSAWLQGILAEDDLANDEIFSKQMNDAFRQDDAGWQSRIGSAPIGEEQPMDSSETLDWLTELEQAAPDLSASGGPDWSSSKDRQPPESVEPLPEWLVNAEPDLSERLHQETAEPEAELPGVVQPGPAEESAVEVEQPLWLQQAASSIQEPAEPGDDALMDWMKLESAESVVPEPVDDQAVNWLAGGEEELPEWLFSESTPIEPAGLPAELAETGAEPPLGEGLETPVLQPSDDFQPLEPVPAGESLPDWLTSEEEIPDWLQPSLETQEEPATASLAAEELAPEGLFSEEPAPGELEQAAEAEEPETLAEEVAPWLAGAAVAGLGLASGEEQPEGDLGWLNELEATYGGLSPNVLEDSALAEGQVDSLGLEPGTALPVWLSKASDEDEQILEESQADEAELKPAEMPSWLQAMRPVGVTAAAASLIGEPEPQQIEGAGPLAGLRGALPAEPDVSQAQKPPVYSIKLQVTDAQQIQAELLRGLIDSEGQAQALPGRPVVTSQQVIRLAIAVLLIFPLLFVLLTGVPQLSLPAPSLEVAAVGRLIDSLPPGAPVLLAVDYQPGFSGEMDAITVPVVQHLFARGAYLAIVSTISTGPVQAEHLLAQVRTLGGTSQQVLTSSANLGFIPGGATGLLAFAQSPRDALPANLRGDRVWDAPGLQSVDTLDKFALVVVTTENPDIARNWVEQVQPKLGATPLVMVLSAQAEPLVRPYFQASPPQVDGLIGGLAGGAAYTGNGVQSSQATRFWTPYGVGALIAVLLMVLVGLVNLISARLARPKEKAGVKGQP